MVETKEESREYSNIFLKEVPLAATFGTAFLLNLFHRNLKASPPRNAKNAISNFDDAGILSEVPIVFSFLSRLRLLPSIRELIFWSCFFMGSGSIAGVFSTATSGESAGRFLGAEVRLFPFLNTLSD